VEERPMIDKSIAGAGLLAVALAAGAQERAIVKQVQVSAPVESVWQAWTTTEGIKTFFAPDGHVEARVDGPFQIYFNPYAKPGLKGADDMRFLALQDRRMLSFTWNSPPHLGEVRGQRTYVTVRLKPASAQATDVSLYHGGWGEDGQWDQSYDYFTRAWDTVLGNLRKRFAEKPIDWTEFLQRMKALQDEHDKAGAK
jgi:uncharacterized protein YndB with AHSA1/START domain